MQGRLSAWLVKHELVHRSWGFDYQAIDTLQIKPEDWDSVVVILYAYGYNYLRARCNYDVVPDGLLASVYHFSKIESGIDQSKEVRIKKKDLSLVKILEFPLFSGFEKMRIFKKENLMICWESIMVIIHTRNVS